MHIWAWFYQQKSPWLWLLLSALSACTTMQDKKTTTAETTVFTEFVGPMDLRPQSIPKRNMDPVTEVVSSKNVYEALACLSDELAQRFRLPKDFYAQRHYQDGNATLYLTNPYTHKKGLYVDVEAQEKGSILRLYPSFNVLSEAWRKLPLSCR